MSEYKTHPVADMFPMLDEDEMVALVNNIKAIGQRHPIIVSNGVIIDGRNRMRACELAGVRPKVKNVDFKDEQDIRMFIIAANLRRRHLTTSQRAMIASELAKLEKHSNQHVAKVEDGTIVPSTTQAAAAKAMNVSDKSVKRARAVAKADPALAEKVKAGEVTLNAAHKQVVKKRAEAQPVLVAPPLYKAPDEDEPDLPPELPGDRGEPAERQMAPSKHARDLLASAMALSDFDRGWLASELSKAR